MEIEILIHKVKESIEKDLILVFLKRYSTEFLNLLDIRKNAFNEGFPFEKLKQYAEELHKAELIKIEKSNPSSIKYNSSDIFFSTAGHIKLISESENLRLSASTLREVRNKDLILYYLKYKNLRNLDIVADLHEMIDLFPFIAQSKVEYYIEELRSKGLIKPMDNNEDVFRYNYKSDAFLEKGGFTIEYFQNEIEKAEFQRLSEEVRLSPEELKKKKNTDKKKEYIDRVKTNITYYILKSLIPTVLGITLVFFILVKFKIISQEGAISFITCLINLIK